MKIVLKRLSLFQPAFIKLNEDHHKLKLHVSVVRLSKIEVKKLETFI